MIPPHPTDLGLAPRSRPAPRRVASGTSLKPRAIDAKHQQRDDRGLLLIEATGRQVSSRTPVGRGGRRLRRAVINLLFAVLALVTCADPTTDHDATTDQGFTTGHRPAIARGMTPKQPGCRVGRSLLVRGSPATRRRGRLSAAWVRGLSGPSRKARLRWRLPDEAARWGVRDPPGRKIRTDRRMMLANAGDGMVRDEPVDRSP